MKATVAAVASNEKVSAKDAKWAERYREETKDLAKHLDTAYMDLAERLYTIFDLPAPGDVSGKPLFQVWGFDSFGDYAENELGIHRRKAERLRAIWYRLKIDLSAMDDALRDRVVALGFSKVRELIRVLTVKNAKEWVARAEKESYEELCDTIKKHIEKRAEEAQKAAKEGKTTTPDPLPPQPEVLHPLAFSLYDDQQEVVVGALQRAQELSGSDKKSHNLTLICTDFLATNDFLSGDLKQKLLYIMKLEKLLGVRLVVADGKTFEVLHGVDTLESISKAYNEAESA